MQRLRFQYFIHPRSLLFHSTTIFTDTIDESMIILYKKFGDEAVLYCSRNFKTHFYSRPMAQLARTCSTANALFLFHQPLIRTYQRLCILNFSIRHQPCSASNWADFESQFKLPIQIYLSCRRAPECQEWQQ
jgi:hypothetical protein